MPKSLWQNSSDGELLDACRAGNTEAFSALWERHRFAALKAARSLAPTLDPDDLVSEAYLKIFELVLDGRGPSGAFRPYLYQVVRTSAADRYRSPEQTSSELDQIPDLHEAGPWEDNSFDLNATAEAFSTLDERWQAVLWYAEVEGMPPRQMAPLLGLSANAASALLVRAREGLQSAWVAAHANRELAQAECRSTVEQLQRFQRGKLTARASRRVAAHLDNCTDCAAAAAEALTLNRRLGLVLAGVMLGGVGTSALLAKLGFGITATGGSAAALGAAGAAASASSAGGSGGASAGTASAGVAAGSGGSLALPVALVTGLTVVAAAVTGLTVASASGVFAPFAARHPQSSAAAVSYTHLTLPTKRIV